MEKEILIESAVFQTKDEIYYLQPRDGLKYILESYYYGDHSENWIIVIDEGTKKPLSLHNLKFCVNYTFKEGGAMNTTTEYCPHHDGEVEIPADKPSCCPECGELILPCSTCNFINDCRETDEGCTRFSDYKEAKG